MGQPETKWIWTKTGGDGCDGFATAISLHAHTHYSREYLGFIPALAARIPVLFAWMNRAIYRCTFSGGIDIDFSKCYWTPPASPLCVLKGESRQIENLLDRRALVSITDHDDITPGLELSRSLRDVAVPISLEWTVPLFQGSLHLGVHNLPTGKCIEAHRQLRSYTLRPIESELPEILEMLSRLPGVLVVLNHPLWDHSRIGSVRHAVILHSFLARCGGWIHAMEANGFRSWPENRTVMEIADQMGYPVVSGGDRHGLQPNVLLNGTASTTFAEFAEEVRRDRRSRIIALPRYRDPLPARMLEVASESLRPHLHLPPGRRQWLNRVFAQLEGQPPKELLHYWPKGGPPLLRTLIRLVSWLGSPSLRPAWRLALAQEGTWP